MSAGLSWKRVADAGGAGALAGGLATLAMTAVMVAARRAGLMGEMPPEKITAHALDKFGVDRHPAVQDTLASALHVAFGVGAGALFGVVEERLEPAVPRVLAGLGYGTAIWAVSYAGWVPAVGIMAMPDDDRPGRPQSMLVAHWVYGVALVLILHRLRTGKEPRGIS